MPEKDLALATCPLGAHALKVRDVRALTPQDTSQDSVNECGMNLGWGT